MSGGILYLGGNGIFKRGNRYIVDFKERAGMIWVRDFFGRGWIYKNWREIEKDWDIIHIICK